MKTMIYEKSGARPMKDLSVKRRYKLRTKDAKEVLAWIEDGFGIDLNGQTDLECGFVEDRKAYLAKGKVIAIEIKGGLMPTIHGLMEHSPKKRWVTVDMGAVRFIANGADVMSPGIVDADPLIEKGDMVWVRDQKNLRPLCVGRALMDGKDMIIATSGKAISTVHYVGDPIFNIQV
jgi:PUA-domain protein